MCINYNNNHSFLEPFSKFACTFELLVTLARTLSQVHVALL